MFLIGDSTLVNQFYGQIIGILDVKGYIARGSKPGVFPATMPTFVHIDDYNLTINRAFHHIKAGPFRDFTFAIFDVDVLDSLGFDGSCDHVIVLGFGIHFRQWSRSAFTDRVIHIKSAIIRYRERCPRAPVIIKGAHMSCQIKPKDQHEFTSKSMAGTDFFVAEILRTMKMHLRDYGIMFFDAVDMNMAYPVPNTTHMPLTVVTQELFMILSMICL